MFWYGLSLLVIVLDQTSKQLAESHLRLHEPLAILPSFNLTLMYNKGAAFSFLSDAGGWQRPFFVTLSTAVSLGLIIWLFRLREENKPVLKTAIALILGGAVGNLIDRALNGQVVDFIQVYYSHYYFPAFNLADSAITLGAALLMLDMFLENRQAATPGQHRDDHDR